jgi:uncharacterized cofD-like protein
MFRKPQNFVVIGGGTGSFTVLSALKRQVPHLTALVSMADDGASTGKLRDELGVLPPGDVRQCLVALSEAPEQLRELFNYRFEEGTLAGHSFGNLFLSASEKVAGNFADAVRMAGEILRIDGEVIPITLDNVRLALQWEDSKTVRGEGRIDTMDFGKYQGTKPHLYLEPDAHINPEAERAIEEADVVIIAPGDIYTSLGSLLVVGGVPAALAKTKAKIMYISNLVTKPGQTMGFSVADHAAEIERFAEGPILDYVLYNTAQPPQDVLERYTREGEVPVQAKLEEFAGKHYKAVGFDLLAAATARKGKGDLHAAHRSLIRHDSSALAVAITKTAS